MSTLTTYDYSLPRQLKRPFYTFLLILAFAFVLALGVSAVMWMVSGSSDALVLVGVIGSAASLGFGIVVLVGWQNLTVFADHLVLNTLRTESTVFYRDVGEVKAVILEGGPKSPSSLLLFLHHRGSGKSPLMINMQIFAAKDRRLLLELIHEGGPDAQLNALSEKIRQG